MSTTRSGWAVNTEVTVESGQLVTSATQLQRK